MKKLTFSVLSSFVMLFVFFIGVTCAEAAPKAKKLASTKPTQKISKTVQKNRDQNRL